MDTNPKQGGMQNPFADLELEGLPEGAPGVETARQSLASEPVKDNATPQKVGRVVLRREKSGRGGKTVVVAYDFATHLSVNYLEDLAKRLRKALGCGSSVQNRTIEVQGDQPSKVRAFLEQEGFRVAGV